MKTRATVICSRADSILLVTRGNGRWALPGGTVKRHETAYDGALRELAEETGMLAPALEFLFVFSGFQKMHYVFQWPICRAAVPRVSREIVDYAWHRATEPLPLEASVSTREIVRLFATRVAIKTSSAEPLPIAAHTTATAP